MPIWVWIIIAVLTIDTVFILALWKNPLKGRAKKGDI